MRRIAAPSAASASTRLAHPQAQSPRLAPSGSCSSWPTRPATAPPPRRPTSSASSASASTLSSWLRTTSPSTQGSMARRRATAGGRAATAPTSFPRRRTWQVDLFGGGGRGSQDSVGRVARIQGTGWVRVVVRDRGWRWGGLSRLYLGSISAISRRYLDHSGHQDCTDAQGGREAVRVAVGSRGQPAQVLVLCRLSRERRRRAGKHHRGAVDKGQERGHLAAAPCRVPPGVRLCTSAEPRVR